jgi:hypothetical protein
MNAFNRLFRPLGDAAKAFFKHDLALRRSEAGVEIVLEERPRDGRAVKKSLTRAEESDRKAREELLLMRGQLGEVLDELPSTREAMRHLAFIEHALARKGLRALQKLPVEVLQRGLEQFEGLVTNWSPVGLAALRSKIAVAIIDREHEQPEEPDEDIYRTAAVLDSTPRAAPAAPSADELGEDAALAAAYAALGAAAPAAGVQMQGELGSQSARTLGRTAAGGQAPLDALRLRELQG